jgi:pyruvate dehydrogenase E2 component (dihydrolipoamide acetyltransferase)
MDAGTLVLWKVKPGDRIKRGDVIAEVETQKGIIEVECFEEGIVDEIVVQPGTKVPVGSVLATLRLEGAPARVTAPAAEAVPATPAATPLPAPAIAAAPVSARGQERRIRISPLARKIAAELGVDLDSVSAAPDGSIGRAEVERAAAAQKVAAKAPPAEIPPVAAKAPPAEPVPAAKPAADFQAGMRRAIAAAMARANREIPHYYLETHVDMSRALRWLEAENLKRSIKDRLLPAVILIRAVAQSLVDVPELNGYWIDDRHQPQEAIHIGFAISLRQGGLIAPAIHHADQKSLDELMEAMRDLIMRTRAGRLRSSEMSDATITLTNLGDMGVESVFGVIYPPQVALVGFGKIADQPWAENGMLGVRPIVTATLSADHRATDGARGAQFLMALNRHLQEVEK